MQASEYQRLLQKYSAEGLRITEDDINKALATGLFKEACKTYAANAAKLREEPIFSPPFSTFKLFDTNGNRLKYESDPEGYFPRRDRLSTFADLVMLYKKPEDISQLEDILWAICDEYTWSLPAHLGYKSLERLETDGYTIDLFASETGAQLSVILFHLGELLSPIVVKRVKHCVKERIIDRFLEQTFHWEHSRNNWAAVCGDSVGTCAIYLEDDVEKQAKILERLETAFGSFMESFTEDGACLEGIGYWGYGFGHYVSYAEMLYLRTNGEIDWFAPEKVHKVALFPQKCFFKGGRTISYSDGQDSSRWNLLQLSFLKTRYPDIVFPEKSASYVGFGSIITFTQAIRWSLTVQDFPQAPAACYTLPDAQWLICSSENGVGFSAKGGHNEEPHNHNDIGGFLVYKNGESILADIGNGEYTKDYFNDNYRYTFFVNGSQSHNVPIINGQYQAASPAARARSQATLCDICETGMTVDIAAAYDLAELSSLKRSFAFCKTCGKVTVTDTFSFTSQPESIVERFVSYADVEVLPGKIVLHSGEESMALCYDEKAFSFSTYVETFNDHAGIPTDIHVLDFTALAPGAQCTYTFTVE